MVTFKIEPDSIGFHAWSPELPGCHSHGVDRAEALANLKDAVRLYLDDVMEESLLPAAGKRTAPKRKLRARTG
ncbi:MAG TPA: type II toxin-antitoxin system HicB family antitoxin [Rhizomicrobium sp.]|jgi:predicted RNase H-like HicB family nuclease